MHTYACGNSITAKSCAAQQKLNSLKFSKKRGTAEAGSYSNSPGIMQPVRQHCNKNRVGVFFESAHKYAPKRSLKMICTGRKKYILSAMYIRGRKKIVAAAL